MWKAQKPIHNSVLGIGWPEFRKNSRRAIAPE